MSTCAIRARERIRSKLGWGFLDLELRNIPATSGLEPDAGSLPAVGGAELLSA